MLHLFSTQPMSFKYTIAPDHTPTPWIIDNADDDEGTTIIGANGEWICSPSGKSIGQAIDNAERIVCCVNAMRGVERPESIMEDIQSMIAWIDDGGDQTSQDMAQTWRAKYPKNGPS